MKYKAIIFDMDGVIVDTETIESRSFEKILKEYGKKPVPYPNGLIHDITGMDVITYYENFKNKYNIQEDIEVLRNKKHAHWKQIAEEEEINSFPGFVELVELFKKENFKIGLASNKSESFINLILEKLGVKHHFSVIVGSAKGRKRKPAPDIYVHTAKELKIKPRECIVLEDSEVGIISAKSAGMKVVSVPNIYTKDEQDFSKADITVNSLSDIKISLLNSL